MSNTKFYKTVTAYCILLVIPLVALPQYGISLSTKSEASSLTLKDILKDMENRYGVYFTYKNSTVSNRPGHLYNRADGLEKALKEVLEPEGLKFKKVNNIYVIFSPGEKQTVLQLKREARKTDLSQIWASAVLESIPSTRLKMFTSYMNAVEIAVKGRVTNEIGDGMPGVNIIVKGSSAGTTTDFDGNYTINVPENGTLIFSFIGYSTQEIPVNNQTLINIVLQPDLKMLNEVVVMGYGTVERKDLIGSVGTASSKDFGEVAVSNAQQLIQGKVSGVQVINANGLPGSDVKITVRGTGTFTNADPLYVIDGIQGSANQFNAISPYDIESVTVLKDASSTAIYGANAANGVVIVTTKKAKAGATKVTYNGYYGVAQPWKKLDIMNSAQYIDLVTDITNNKLTPKLQTADVLVDRTDWQDAIFRTAKLTEHNIGVAGGTDKVLYNASTTYTNQDGVMEDYNFKRVNFRLGLEENVGKRFKFGQVLNFRYTVKSGNTASFVDALRMPPYAPIYDPTNLGGFSKVTSVDDLNDAYNPLTSVRLSEKRDRDLLSFGQFYGEVEIIDGLRFRSQLSIDFNNYNGYNYKERNANGNLINANGIEEYFGWGISPLLENYFNYKKQLGIHSFDVIVGNTYKKGAIGRRVNLIGSNFPNNDLKNILLE